MGLATCWGRIPLRDVGGTCSSLLPWKQTGKLRPGSTVTAFMAARETRPGKGLDLGWAGLIGWASFPEDPQLGFTKWNTLSTECLHFVQLLPQINSSYGHPGLSQKNGIWAKPRRSPGFLRRIGGCSSALANGWDSGMSGDGYTTLNIVLACSLPADVPVVGSREQRQ